MGQLSSAELLDQICPETSGEPISPIPAVTMTIDRKKDEELTHQTRFPSESP